jgi:hypothetical protein
VATEPSVPTTEVHLTQGQLITIEAALRVYAEQADEKVRDEIDTLADEFVRLVQS